MQQIADEYAADHPGFALNLITTPDRPSYIQKYETLAAANKLPELFDTDATPFAQKLAAQGKMVDVDLLLEDLGSRRRLREAALNYQRFDDGSLYMVPFEFQLEFFWYNKALFEQAGVPIPATLDDFAATCEALRAEGITRSRSTARTSGRSSATWRTTRSVSPARVRAEAQDGGCVLR